MMRRILILASVLCLATSAVAQRDLVGPVAAGNSAFAFDLYRQLRANETGNLFFSPYSVSTAMTMTMVAAGGQTAAQMRAVLHLPQYDGPTHMGVNQIADSLGSRAARHPGATLATANSLWGQEGLAFKPRFLAHLERFYGSRFQTVDYLNDAEAARDTINGWVAKETQDHIQNLFPQGTITTDTRLVLANAIYFKSDWLLPFDESETKDATFTAGDGTEVTVPLMRRVAVQPYYEDETLQAVSIRYALDGLSMLMVLPRNESGLSDIEASLDAERFAQIINGMDADRYSVELYLPRFEMSGAFTLNDALIALGMELPFSDDADFRGITEAARLKIDAVVHQAFVAVDEIGTEAAAATGVSVGITSAPPPRERVTFRADHPFLFFIRDEQTGSILFVGRVVDPTTST